MSYKKQELFTLREHIRPPLLFGGVLVANLFSLLCCVCLRPVFCGSNVASIYGLSIIVSSSCVLWVQCCQYLWTSSSRVLWVKCCQYLWTVNYCVFVLCSVGPILSVSLDCQFLCAFRFSLMFIYEHCSASGIRKGNCLPFSHLDSSQFLVDFIMLKYLVFCGVFFVLFVFVLYHVPGIIRVSGFSILDYPFGFL